MNLGGARGDGAGKALADDDVRVVSRDIEVVAAADVGTAGAVPFPGTGDDAVEHVVPGDRVSGREVGPWYGPAQAVRREPVVEIT